MEIKKPIYNTVGTVDCEVNHPVYGWIPFTASPDDPEEHGRDIYQRAVSGEFGPVAECVQPVGPETAESAG